MSLAKKIMCILFITLSTSVYADMQRGLTNYQAIMTNKKNINELSQQELQEVLNAHTLIESKSGGCSSPIESQIDGEFKGWSGETIFKLTNGQIWQQSNYSYTYSYSYRPKITIYSASGGCKLKVDGLCDTIGVKRLK